MSRPSEPRRRRVTSPTVLHAERVARALITLGGLGTICTVSLICLFLVVVVVPLFQEPQLEARGGSQVAEQAGPGVLHAFTDEHQTVVGFLRADGSVRVVELGSGAVLHERPLFEEATPTAWSAWGETGDAAFGFEDGRIVVGRLGFQANYVLDEPEELRSLAQGEVVVWRNGAVERTAGGQLRHTTPAIELDQEFELAGDSAIRALDLVRQQSGTTVAVWTADERLSVLRLRTRMNLITEQAITTYRELTLPYAAPATGAPLARLLLTNASDNVLLVWEDGHVQRYDCRPGVEPSLAEEHELLEEGARLSALSFALGRASLLVGDDRGRVGLWFRTKPENARGSDGAQLERAQILREEGQLAPVSSVAPSPRSRVVVVGYADGVVRLYYASTGELVATLPGRAWAPVELALLTPKEKGVFALAQGELWSWDVDLQHPEVSLISSFQPHWYEGYAGPDHVWQSSSGASDSEPKFGLWPLVFGTLKATTFSMLFAAPLAILAAIYTSQFLSARRRNRIKAVVEVMASLPSVVLGYMAAVVIAPYVQAHVMQVLVLLFALPLLLMLGGHLWQLASLQRQLEWGGWPRALCTLCVLPLALLVAWFGGPLFERVGFDGDLFAWLAGRRGTGTAGWFLALLPLSLLGISFAMGRLVTPLVRSRSVVWDTRRSSRVDLARFLAGTLLAAGIAWALGAGLTGLGQDPRGLLYGNYEQLNALVVGLVMGFAVIPIIYTIAEDALSSVPEHLRLASLSAGATPWQTAVRIVIPTATSGLFSAVMVGLGRAVGETMIVLMATGNTPVRDWNLFNGFRTLSANIAVELPEAVPNSTHYRMLFLSALVLFALTFVLNTLAEVVRQRFRKRAYEL